MCWEKMCQPWYSFSVNRVDEFTTWCTSLHTHILVHTYSVCHTHLHLYICVLRRHSLLAFQRSFSIAKYKVKYKKRLFPPSQAFQLHKNIYVHASDIKFTIFCVAFMQLIKHIGTLRMKLFSTYILHNMLCDVVASVDLTSRAKKRLSEIKHLRHAAVYPARWYCCIVAGSAWWKQNEEIMFVSR